MLDINSQELHSGKPSKAQILIMSPARLRGDVTEGSHISLVSSTSSYCIIVSVRLGGMGFAPDMRSADQRVKAGMSSIWYKCIKFAMNPRDVEDVAGDF